MGKLGILSIPSKNKIMVIRIVEPDEGLLLIDDIALNAVLVAHANSDKEARDIIKDMENR
jgi:hypothetical protein